jgi:MinD-like ATPase involved in chromosome partitioning or flagellar assembly
MRVITFYSFKGGVGRTLACANFGKYLAKAGQKVVLLDMDLEAPGLDAKLFPDAATGISSGVLDQLTAFQNGLPLPSLSPIPIDLPEEVTQHGGRLQLIPAGNYFDLNRYYKALSNLDWDLLLKTEEGLAFWFDFLKRIEDQFQPDVLVIDSRTGITEVSGLCTQVLPDTVLLLTSTSPESLRGTKRIYETIATSRLIKEGRGPRNKVDLRVVLTRVPRRQKEDFDAFDRKMMLMLNLEVPRLFYIFADEELATSEYIAMDRAGGKEQSIHTDYVHLFASLNPEDTVGYVKSRLSAFREGLTVRKERESRRVIQELLTLFPRSEVYLEAARYYRLVKEPEESIAVYLRYLKDVPYNKEIILEFAEVCVAAPQAAVLDQRESVVRYLSTLGPSLMEPQVLSLYCTLVSTPEQLQSIVASVEEDPSKLTTQQYRGTLFRALGELQQWDKLLKGATDVDLKDPVVQRLAAKAHANLHSPEKALQIIRRLPMRDPAEVMPLMEILYDLRTDMSTRDIRKAIAENRHIETYLTHYAAALMDHPSFARKANGELRAWIRELLSEKKGA